VPFEIEIPPERQDKRLLNPKFWRESGELPGVLNWALEGLARLRQQGRFTEPAACRGAVDEYRRDSNPAAAFLTEHTTEKGGVELSSRELYQGYADWCRDCGYRPLSIHAFAKVVRKVHPRVDATPNAISQLDGSRAKNWIGLQLLQNALGARQR